MQLIKGNLFTSPCQTLVNTVNCVGVMGAGIALEFKFRYPDMFSRYQEICLKKQLDIGKLWLYTESEKWVLNFPTKKHWKFPSQPGFLEQGLDKFMQTYEAKGIQSIAFPLLGAAKGGLSEDLVLSIMERYLSHCTIPVEVYQYDPNAEDDLYQSFKHRVLRSTESELMQHSGLRKQALNKLKAGLDNPRIKSISQLATQPGIGLVTLEKAFRLVSAPTPQQSSLFH
jgi:O-acetyl-ADP-ribose deacetylase (regulator of RNase III)